MLRLSSLADGAKATLRKGMPMSLPVTSSVTVLRPLWLATRARQSLRYVTLKPFPLSKFAASYRLKHLVELLHVVDVLGGFDNLGIVYHGLFLAMHFRHIVA